MKRTKVQTCPSGALFNCGDLIKQIGDAGKRLTYPFQVHLALSLTHSVKFR